MTRSGLFRNVVLITAGMVTSLSVGVYWGRQDAKAGMGASSSYKFFDTLVDLYAQIKRNYVEPVDDAQLLDGAINGMLSELDPFSSYFDKDELVKFDKETRGQFSGIGAEFVQDPTTGHVTVVSPLEDSPALKAGMLAGDRVVSINGQSVAGIPLKDFFAKMAGPLGSEVKVIVIHHGETKPVELTIKRAVITVTSVKGYRHTDDGSGQWDYLIDPERRIAYVRIRNFSENTADELDKALLPLINSKEGLKGIIMDLRFNPGGLLTAGIDVADRFLTSGRIVSTRGRDGKEQFVAEAKRDGTYPNIPTVVLINQYSASAAEIVAGALGDHGRALLIGERTFGKGSVQSLITMDGGQAALKLTTAYYYLPSGRNVAHRKGATEWGVDPDPNYKIELTRDETVAVLQSRRDSEIIKPRAVNRTQPATVPGTEPGQAEVVDKQLQRAVESLTAYLNNSNGQPFVSPRTQPAPASQPATAPKASTVSTQDATDMPALR